MACLREYEYKTAEVKLLKVIKMANAANDGVFIFFGNANEYNDKVVFVIILSGLHILYL